MLIEELKLDKNKYYFLCAAGIGDTMIVCGFYNALKKKYNADIVIVVPEKQSFIPEMFGIKDYKAVDLGCTNIFEVIDKCTMLSDAHPHPQKGHIYLAHPAFHNELSAFFAPVYYRKSKIKFLDWYRQFLHLPLDTPFEDFTILPKLSKETEKAVLNLAPFDKVVLISPEATSTESVPARFWQQLVQNLSAQGYTVISNVKNKNNTVLGSQYVPLNLQDSIALAYRCHAVYSVRSGFCDLCYQLGDKLHVYYANRDDLYLYSLKSMFGNDIHEEVEYNLPERLIRGPKPLPVVYRRRYMLFSFITLLEVTEQDNKRIYHICGIPVFKIKKRTHKTKMYILGIPIFSIKENTR